MRSARHAKSAGAAPLLSLPRTLDDFAMEPDGAATVRGRQNQGRPSGSTSSLTCGGWPSVDEARRPTWVIHSARVQMAVPRPPKGYRWLITQTATYDILIAVFAAAIGFSSADNYYSQGRIRLAIIVGFGTVGVVIFTVVKQVVTLSGARAKTSTHELEGCLYTLRRGRVVPDRKSTRLNSSH